MAVTPYLGLYALGRGAVYLVGGLVAAVFAQETIPTVLLSGVSSALFGLVYVLGALALFLSGGLLTKERKIGRLLAIVVLALDGLFQVISGVVVGSLLSLIFGVASLAVVVYLAVWNPLDGRRPEIDGDSPHGIGVDEF